MVIDAVIIPKGSWKKTRAFPIAEVLPSSRVLAKTGFDLIIPDDLKETAPPTADELYLLRTKIDPLGVRELETLAGSRRKEKMRQILREERQSR